MRPSLVRAPVALWLRLALGALCACTAAPTAPPSKDVPAKAVPAAIPRGSCGHGGRPIARAAASAAAPTTIRTDPTRSQRLLDLRPEFGGRSPPAPALQSFDARQLTSWRRPNAHGEHGPRSLVFRSPDLPTALSRASELRLRVRPGSARSLRVLPAAAGGVLGRDRAFRTVVLPLSPSATNDAVTFSIDVRDLLQRSWDSLATGGRLQWVEFVFDDGDAAHTRLEEVSFLDELAAFEAAAGTQQVERNGALRPSLYMHAGASARFEVALDPKVEALTFHLAGTEPRARVRIELAFDGNSTTLFDAEAPAEWKATTVPIAEWRGETVTLTFSNPGSGVGFAAQPEVSATRNARSPDLLFYVVDTLVASRLGAWGSPLAREGVSPTIDRLAANGVTFGSAISPAPWTKPSIASLLSGVDPTVHEVGAHSFTDHMPLGVPLVQERFAAAAYRTASFSANPLASTLSKLERGFDLTLLPSHFKRTLGPLHHPSSAQLQHSLLEWVDEQPNRPFMAYLHTLEVHEYKNALFDWPRPGWTRYDHAIRAQDGALAALLQALEDRQREVVLVFVSDHGESFGDHELHDHGTGLYQSQLHVPLIFHAPRYLPPATDNTLVSTLQVAPTVLALFGLPALPQARDISLLGPGGRTDAGHARPVFASRQWYVWDQNSPPIYAALLPSGVKALRGGGLTDAVYDLGADPCEEHALPWEGNAAARALQSWIDEHSVHRGAFERTYGKVDKGAASERDMARLRALGYAR